MNGCEKNFISANTEIIIFEQKSDTITYITCPEGLTAIVVASSNTAGREWYWVFTDHLGSITTLVRNSDGQKVEMSYDAWGNRRDPATWENYNGTLPSFITDRGYTGHEHLDEFTLINMNGRMYDPQTARFLSPDVVVSDPSNPSSFNPYAYVLNNPLRYTDPSGYEPFTIAAAAIAAFILYGSHAKQNADPATGKWDWNITNWFGKDKPGLMLGITNTSFKSFFSNTTFFVSMDNTNGSGITLGYHTKYHFGGGSSPQNLYFPNDNTSAAEATAVNSIARGTGNYSKITAAIDNYMDILTANVMRSYGGTWLPGIEVVWNGKYGSGSVVGGVPEWWSGGTVTSSQGNRQISINESHNRIGFVPLDAGPNYGAYQNANYRANISIRGNQNKIYVGVTSSNTPVFGGQVVFNASASISVDGDVIQKQALLNGSAWFNLPSGSNVSLTVKGGWNVYFDSGGASVPVYHPIFWPFSLNFKDDFDLK